MDIRIMLGRMIRHCDEIAADIKGYSQGDFEGDGKTQRAVYMSLHQIGELVGRLPQAFKELHPQVPWRGIRQMRNIISHEYIQLDTDIIWRTVTQSIPQFKALLMQCLKAVEEGKEPQDYDKDG